MNNPHDFREQLLYSEQGSEEPFWRAVYEKAFPDMVDMMLCHGDTLGQRRGVDRLIYLANDRVIRIDEKKRRRTYSDILLEYTSVDEPYKPGWMELPLAIDFLAYAFMDTKRVHLFPWLLLRRSWLHYRDNWLQKYQTVTAQNKGYKTLSVAVPLFVVQSSVKQASIIQL